jgi:threonine dehydrogenase-like Zn-dependent dehydrogenase
MEPEQFRGFSAQMKCLNIQFAIGEKPADMELALRSIADGKIDVMPWLGERIGLRGVGQALDELANPASPIRPVVDPRKR